MRIALDTSGYIGFCRGNEDVVRVIQEAERVFLPLMVLAELRAGFLCGTRSQENEATLTRFLNSPRVEVLYPEEQTTHRPPFLPAEKARDTHPDQRSLDCRSCRPARSGAVRPGPAL